MAAVIAGRIGTLAAKLRPSVRAELRASRQRAADFDRRFGVDTAGLIHPTALSIDSPNQVHAVSYGGSDPKRFRDVIAALPIDHSRFTFIDYGSGKGRAILLATEFPFRRVVGIEFSDELHRVAEDNIRRFDRDVSKCGDVSSVCMDAVDYSLPDDCLVCYFCNPFDAPLMTRVLSNIQRSISERPREVFIVYYNPKEAHLFESIDSFRPVVSVGSVRVWRAGPPSECDSSA